MSLEGKIGTFSKLLKENLTDSSRGLTRVSPIFTTHDIESGKPFHLLLRYVGCRVSDLSFTATGAGAGHISDALERENQWGLKDAAVIAIKLLYVAAQIDNQQENAISNVKIYPNLASVTENGYKFWSEDQLARLESMSREEK
jgi:proteasome beta subunit